MGKTGDYHRRYNLPSQGGTACPNLHEEGK